MNNNNKYPKLIFKAELVERDGKPFVVTQLHSKHIQTLDFVVNQLHYEITELRAIERAKQETANQSKIVKADGLTNFLRRGHKR